MASAPRGLCPTPGDWSHPEALQEEKVWTLWVQIWMESETPVVTDGTL